MTGDYQGEIKLSVSIDISILIANDKTLDEFFLEQTKHYIKLRTPVEIKLFTNKNANI
ncbi:hypothetical protein [Colwellia psychrerythraea]|uniref:hypothetical protein n=1 Tax=Colwellia psychrerythraea TaxID=28229 RepID=UPI00167FDECB|nr:hypothetical protein [Colwellia psychrerythraea]